MLETKTKRIVCEVPLETANRFLTAAKMAGTNSQELLRGFVAQYVNDPQPQPDRLPRDHQKWVDMLLIVLRSGDKGCIQTVTSNLVQFERVVRLSALESKRKSS